MSARQAYREWRKRCRATPHSYDMTRTTINGRCIGMRRVGTYTNYVTRAPDRDDRVYYDGTKVGQAFHRLAMARFYRERGKLLLAGVELISAASLPRAPLPGASS